MTVAIPIVAGIGNAIMAEPMVRQLRAAMPEARIVIVALIRPMADVFQGIPNIETLVTGRGSKNLLAGMRKVRELKPDVYLVPFPSNRWQYNAMAKASGAKRVIVHGYPIGRIRALGFLHRDRVPAVRGIHDVVQNLQLLPKLGINPQRDAGPLFEPTAEQILAAKDKIAALNLPSKHFAVMHAGSAKTILAKAKRWPSECYAKVAQRIVAEHDIDVVIVEGPDEVGVSDEIRSFCAGADCAPRIHSLKLTGPLGESAAILSHASFYVGTDSGLAHLSAAVGVPAVTLFAPADPERVCPFGYRDLVVQPPGMGQPPFLYPWSSTFPKLPPGAEHWIQTIRIDDVMAKVHDVFSRGGR